MMLKTVSKAFLHLIVLQLLFENVVNEVRTPVKRNDLCTRNTCYHNGVCVQIGVEPGYKCRCSGTGYYGDRCQYVCPNPAVPARKTSSFPFECIVI